MLPWRHTNKSEKKMEKRVNSSEIKRNLLILEEKVSQLSGLEIKHYCLEFNNDCISS